MSITNGPALLPSERVLRKDMVWFGGVGWRGYWPDTPKRSAGSATYSSLMLVTDPHLIFAPPPVSLLHRLSRFVYLIPPFSFVVFALWSVPALGKGESVSLRRIARFHTWTPAFSGPVMFDTDSGSWQFRLLQNRRPWKHWASKDAMRAQFEVIEAAWQRAQRENV